MNETATKGDLMVYSSIIMSTTAKDELWAWIFLGIALAAMVFKIGFAKNEERK